MSITDCSLLKLPEFPDSRGKLVFIDSGKHIPFDIKRIFYIYNVPRDQGRGAHALKSCDQVLIAVSGGFDVWLDDGDKKKQFRLDSPEYGLYIPPLTWREIKNFSPNSVCLVLASEFFDDDAYYKDYDAFIKAAKDYR